MKKRERSKDEIPFSEMTAAQKRSYLWDYWRKPVLAVIVIIAGLIALIYSMTHTIKPVLCMTIVDGGEDTDFSPYAEQFADESGIPKEQILVSDIVVGTSQTGGGMRSQAGMALYVRLQSGGEDLLIMPEEVFEEYACSGYFLDLTDVVPQEWQEKLVVAQQRYDDYEDVQPEPIPCAIRVRDLPNMPDTLYAQNAVIAISYNPANYDNAAAFLSFLSQSDKTPTSASGE